jgi:hypothetical protein
MLAPQQWTGTVIGDRVIRVKSSKSCAGFYVFWGQFRCFLQRQFQNP